MHLIRKILFPIAILYGFVTRFRNFLFDRGTITSYYFDIPIIAVGNLTVGGTGKTPQIEYLIRLLSSKYKIATLSRGYKRKSKGFVLADSNSNAQNIGDEPFQFYSKFKTIQVAVDSDRKNGIEQLKARPNKPDSILLDDAFQHRKVKAGLSILLTTYGDLYADDYLLPVGNLRESKSGAKRAAIVIVTKCPASLTALEQQKISAKLKLASHQELYFSSIDYDNSVYSVNTSIEVTNVKFRDKLLVAGIAKPNPFFAYLQGPNDDKMTFPDHHHFTESDIRTILHRAQNKIIVTTEKDYMRLQGKLPNEQLFYLPIQSKIISGADNFDKTILNYVGASIRNG